MNDRPTLRRSLNLPMITLYGLGTTIGAGIYALTGKVAGTAGMLAPWAFLLASVMAAFTALSFAEMSSRFPRSAGEAVYVREGLGLPLLSTLVGLLVVLAATVASATLATAFVGYLGAFTALPEWFTILLFVMVLGVVAALGINESVLTAAFITLVEIGGLLLVIWVAREGFATLPGRVPELFTVDGFQAWHGLLAASLLAFYAFLGFEDMVNVAEEVKRVERMLPLAIIITLVVTTLLYMLVSMAAILTVPLEQLGESEAPLALVYELNTGQDSTLVGVVALFAIINGALVQVILASRVLYGLANLGSIPGGLAYIHPRTRTPLVATALVTLLVVVLALWLPLVELATATSVITLVVFSLVNLSLLRLKGQPAPAGVWTVPRWVPLIGFVVSASFALYGLVELML
ncbi:MAG: amino acid permease [Sedimenticola sp.]